MNAKPTILFATPVLRFPAVGGPALRIQNSIKALHRISHLHIFSRLPRKTIGGETACDFYRQYCCELSFSRFKKTLLLSVRDVYGQSTRWKEDFGPILQSAHEIKADAIWLGYGNISYPLLKFIKRKSRFKVVLDTDSVWSRFVARGIPYLENSADRRRAELASREKEKEERWGTRLADVTTAVSECDAQYYRGLAARPDQVHLFSNVIDLDAYRQVPPAGEGVGKPCVYLAGSFAPKSPMEDAARWMIDRVMPLVRAALPTAQLLIVGSGADRVLSDVNRPDVVILGEVPSVLPYLCHADVAVVPLRFESGTRFKILEAGACRIPVVSTTLGAEGIPVVDGKDLRLADEPERFAEAIIGLIQDRQAAARLADNLHALVREKFTIDQLVSEGRSILNFIHSELHC
jgi:glycosyltransferase involved in cell wall biosynthesis